MSTSDNMEMNKDEVLVRFAQAEAPNLTEWMQQYPASAQDIARLAASRWATGIIGEEPTDTTAVTRFREIGIGVLQARRNAAASRITSLTAAATARGLEPMAVAAKLDIPWPLFVKIQRRLIAPASIPQKFIAALAETLGRQADEIRAYLFQPPAMASNLSFRADEMPTLPDQEDFGGALGDDPEATAEQKARWLS